ncbi:hypothetical protein ACP4OV_002379 [Aristida adscensionis]
MMSLRCLCRLVLRAWPKMLAFSPSLLKTIHIDNGYVHPPIMEMAAMSPVLPQDILEDIFALLEIPDLVRASSVCSSWHAAYTSLRGSGRYRRPQTPCLLYTSESAGDNVACLYSLTEKKVYKLTLLEPSIRNRNVIGSSQGLLVTADERSELHIVNPVTGEQMALPSVTTIEQIKPNFDDTGVLKQYEFSQYFGEEEIPIPFVHDLENLRDALYVKAFVFSDSSTGNSMEEIVSSESWCSWPAPIWITPSIKSLCLG